MTRAAPQLPPIWPEISHFAFVVVPIEPLDHGSESRETTHFGHFSCDRGTLLEWKRAGAPPLSCSGMDQKILPVIISQELPPDGFGLIRVRKRKGTTSVTSVQGRSGHSCYPRLRAKNEACDPRANHHRKLGCDSPCRQASAMSRDRSYARIGKNASVSVHFGHIPDAHPTDLGVSFIYTVWIPSREID